MKYVYINRGVFQHLTNRELYLLICKILNSLKIGGKRKKILLTPLVHLPLIYPSFTPDFLRFQDDTQLLGWYQTRVSQPICFLVVCSLLHKSFFYFFYPLAPCGRGLGRGVNMFQCCNITIMYSNISFSFFRKKEKETLTKKEKIVIVFYTLTGVD